MGRWACRLPSKHEQSQQQDLIPFLRCADVFTFLNKSRFRSHILPAHINIYSTFWNSLLHFYSLAHSLWLAACVVLVFPADCRQMGTGWVCVLLNCLLHSLVVILLPTLTPWLLVDTGQQTAQSMRKKTPEILKRNIFWFLIKSQLNATAFSYPKRWCLNDVYCSRRKKWFNKI